MLQTVITSPTRLVTSLQRNDKNLLHSFDVHGGTDREDSTNIAGSGFVIHHNTFGESSQPAVHLRGVPIHGAWVYKNETSDDKERHAFIQNLPPDRFHVTDNKTGVRRSLDGFASSSTSFRPGP
jgi:hypothetical protein